MEKNKVYIVIIISLFIALLYTGADARRYKTRYEQSVEQYINELTIARERSAVLSDTLNRAREEVGAIGESLGKQRTSVAELRELITEIRTRYEKMEKLLYSPRNDYSDIHSSDSCIDSSNGE